MLSKSKDTVATDYNTPQKEEGDGEEEENLEQNEHCVHTKQKKRHTCPCLARKIRFARAPTGGSAKGIPPPPPCFAGVLVIPCPDSNRTRDPNSELWISVVEIPDADAARLEQTAPTLTPSSTLATACRLDIVAVERINRPCINACPPLLASSEEAFCAGRGVSFSGRWSSTMVH